MFKLIVSAIFLVTVSSVSVATTTVPPISEPIVSTIVASHPGAVGGILVDQLGYVYIADFKETVWRLNPNSLEMKPYATGFYGASGNTFDNNGTLYQASYFGHYINRVSRSGEVSTVVDEGLNGPVGLIFNEANELLICNCNDQSIMKIDATGQLGEFARSEHFNCPNGIAKDEVDNVYVVSFSSSKIVKITPQGETSLFADSQGNGIGHITYLNGVFYATSFQDNKVYRISPAGVVSVLAGTGERGQQDGTGSNALFSNPNGIYADASSNHLYINDYVGDPNASGIARTPFSIRRIELPSLTNILDYTLSHDSIDAARSVYREFLSNPRNAGEKTEPGINGLGWKYMSLNQFQEAVALFELNAESHPDSWRAFSSLGASYMKIEENQKAIEVLQRSLELNPDNLIAKGRLETLGAMD